MAQLLLDVTVPGDTKSPLSPACVGLFFLLFFFCGHVIVLLWELFMFSSYQVELLGAAVDALIAIRVRRFNSEPNQGIKDILATEIAALRDLHTAIHNPALLTKGGK